MAESHRSAEELRREIITLAFVGTALADSQDFFSAIGPIFGPIASDLNGSLFDATQLTRELRARYGIVIPEDVCGVVATRLHRLHFLQPVKATNTDAIYQWTAQPSPAFDAVNFEAKINELCSQLVGFRDGFPSPIFLDIDSEALLALFLDHLKNQDEDVRFATRAITSGSIEGASADPDGPGLGHNVFKTEGAYFSARFLEDLAQRQHPLLGWISSLSSAALISEVVLSLKEPPSRTLGLSRVSFYLDAPVLMELLGCSGEARKRDATFVIARLKSEGARVIALSVGVEEIESNLKAFLDQAPVARYGPSRAALNRGETTEVYLRQVLQNPRHFIERAGIQIVDVARASLTPSQLNAFPQSAADELLSRIAGTYQRPAAAERDAVSITFIQRMRGFKKVEQLGEARHIFVTRNERLHVQVVRYLRDRKWLQAGEIAPTIEASQLTAIVWLASGDVQRAEIGSRHLLLNAARLVETAPSAVNALRDRLREVSPITSEQFEALLAVPRCEQFAMDYISGSIPRAMGIDPLEVFEKVKRSTAAELEAEHEQKLRERDTSFQEAIRKQEDELGALAAEKARIEAQVQSLAQEARARESADKQRAERIVQEVRELRNKRNILLKRLTTGICLAWLAVGVIVIFGENQWEQVGLVEKLLGLIFGPIAVLLGIRLGQRSWESMFDDHWQGLLVKRGHEAGVSRWIPVQKAFGDE